MIYIVDIPVIIIDINIENSIAKVGNMFPMNE